MTKTYKQIKDSENRDALEITDTRINKQVIDKLSIVAEIARLEELLSHFSN